MSEYQKRLIELATKLLAEAKRADFEGCAVRETIEDLQDHIDSDPQDFEDQSEEATITRAETTT